MTAAGIFPPGRVLKGALLAEGSSTCMGPDKAALPSGGMRLPEMHRRAARALDPSLCCVLDVNGRKGPATGPPSAGCLV